MNDRARTSRILLRLSQGERGAAEEIFPLLYEELHGLAHGLLRGERPGHSLQTTALVHEAYLRLVDQAIAGVEGRSHFVGIACRCMRQILVDHARRRRADKRGGDRERVPLDEILDRHERAGVDVVDLHDALDRLAELDERKTKVVELRFFGGLSIEEAAAALGIAAKTAEADWYLARAWLRRALEP